MHIAYAARFDPMDVRQWSGISRHMIDAMRRAGAKVDVIGPLETRGELRSRARRRLARARGRTTDLTREPVTTKGWGRQVDAALRHSSADLLLTSDVPTIVAAQDSRPKAIWTGSSLSVLIDYYDSYSNLSRRSFNLGVSQERALLRQCDHVLYATEWVRRSSIDHYGLDPARVSVVPFGANVAGPAREQEHTSMLERRLSGPFNILFLGVDWIRKRGDFAVSVVAAVRERGIDAQLVVVGCQPPPHVRTRHWVRSVGYLDKSSDQGLSRLTDELAAARFLLHPTAAETFGIALCEAAAFGVPVIGTKTGGIPEICLDGETGVLLPLGAPPDAYADGIVAMSEPEKYRRAGRAAYNRWRTDLNWDTAASRALALLAPHAGRRPA